MCKSVLHSRVERRKNEPFLDLPPCRVVLDSLPRTSSIHNRSTHLFPSAPLPSHLYSAQWHTYLLLTPQIHLPTYHPPSNVHPPYNPSIHNHHHTLHTHQTNSPSSSSSGQSSSPSSSIAFAAASAFLCTSSNPLTFSTNPFSPSALFKNSHPSFS